MGTHVFPAVETVRETKDTVSIFSPRGSNYHKLHTSRAVYLILVRALEKKEAETFRNQLLYKFSSCNFMFATERDICYRVKQRKLKFATFSQQP